MSDRHDPDQAYEYDLTALDRLAFADSYDLAIQFASRSFRPHRASVSTQLPPPDGEPRPGFARASSARDAFYPAWPIGSRTRAAHEVGHLETDD